MGVVCLKVLTVVSNPSSVHAWCLAVVLVYGFEAVVVVFVRSTPQVAVEPASVGDVL